MDIAALPVDIPGMTAERATYCLLHGCVSISALWVYAKEFGILIHILSF